MMTFVMVENCFKVALTSADTRASAPTPGDESARQKRTVAVPLLILSVKSGPPVGWDPEQFEGPLSRLFSSEKYPAVRSSGVGPAIKSCMAKVPTLRVGEVRLTGKVAAEFESESGNLEKYTLTWYPLEVAVAATRGAVESSGAFVRVEDGNGVVPTVVAPGAPAPHPARSNASSASGTTKQEIQRRTETTGGTIRFNLLHNMTFSSLQMTMYAQSICAFSCHKNDNVTCPHNVPAQM
jgi:hypothetical protein